MPSERYWDNRYNNDDTAWDIGKISQPIKQWFDNCQNHNKKILIPGAGSGFEAGYAYENGFKNTYYLDFSKAAITRFSKAFPMFPKAQIIHEDFFNLSDFSGFFDVIIEQTFFCAIEPVMRLEYVKKAYDLLNENGTVVGLLFNKSLNNSSPPFGGTKKEYISIFETNFNVLKMENCINSIAPRAKTELWFSMEKYEL